MQRGYSKSNLDYILSKCMERCDMEWQCNTPPANNTEQTMITDVPVVANFNNPQDADLQYAQKLGTNIKALVDIILQNAGNVDVSNNGDYSYIFDNHQIVQEFINVSNTLHSLSDQIESILDALNNSYQNTQNNQATQIITGDIQF